MISARTKYYLDLTRYNLGFSLLIGLMLGTRWAVVTFGTFGMLVGLISYKYFQNSQYYFYYNIGITKTELISLTWSINLVIAAFFYIIIR
jgi:hypothetical protein